MFMMNDSVSKNCKDVLDGLVLLQQCFLNVEMQFEKVRDDMNKMHSDQEVDIVLGELQSMFDRHIETMKKV